MMAGAHEAWSAGVDTEGIEFGAQPVVALGDVAQGTASEAAREGVRLVMLGNQWSRRAGPTLVQASMAWAPVAVTPDELGRAWHRGRLALTVHTTLNEQALPPVETAKLGVPDAGALIARLVQHRAVSAGTLLALPGLPRAGLAGGDAGVPSVAIEAFDAQGQSVFGAISQGVRRLPAEQALPLERQ
jgi:fumarylacetoacetate (FAA) hydrolase